MVSKNVISIAIALRAGPLELCFEPKSGVGGARCVRSRSGSRYLYGADSRSELENGFAGN